MSRRLKAILLAWACFSLEATEPETYVIKSQRLYKNGTLEEGAVWFREGKIISPENQADHVFDFGDLIVSPGFIDLHCNGALGVDFSKDPENLPKVSAYLPTTGVTSFLAGVISSKNYESVLPRLNEFLGRQEGAIPLGIHLEGPFINHSKKGMHDETAFPTPPWNFETIEKVYSNLAGVKMITLAPELFEGLDLLKDLKNRGIVVALGHSEASGKILEQAIDYGAAVFTHLFNAMPPLHHRDDGMVHKALINPSLSFSLLCDGYHLCPETVRLSFLANPNGIFLVTDSSPVMGMEEGHYEMGGQRVSLKGRKTTLKGSDTLAGSATPLNEMVRHFLKFTHCTLEEALYTVTQKPASIIDAHEKGSLEVGKDADIVVLDTNLNVHATFIGGKGIFLKKR